MAPGPPLLPTPGQIAPPERVSWRDCGETTVPFGSWSRRGTPKASDDKGFGTGVFSLARGRATCYPGNRTARAEVPMDWIALEKHFRDASTDVVMRFAIETELMKRGLLSQKQGGWC